MEQNCPLLKGKKQVLAGQSSTTQSIILKYIAYIVFENDKTLKGISKSILFLQSRKHPEGLALQIHKIIL